MINSHPKPNGQAGKQHWESHLEFHAPSEALLRMECRDPGMLI